MKTKRNTVGWGCFLIWLFATLLAVIAGFAVFFVAMAGLGESLGRIPDLTASLIMAGCFGTIIGVSQWSILSRYVQRSALWIGVTLLGFLISSPVLLSMSSGFGPTILPISSFNMTVALGSTLGVAQWLTISRKVNRSSLWIGISLVGWFVAGWIGLALKTLSWEWGMILYWLGLFFAGTLLSALGMIWLLTMKANAGYSETAAIDRPLWRRIMKLPGTRIGWWSVALAATYVVLLLILSILPGIVSWGQTVILLIIVSVALCEWAAGITGLIALMEQRERSVIVWIAMLPAVYSLINILYIALREFLVPQ